MEDPPGVVSGKPAQRREKLLQETANHFYIPGNGLWNCNRPIAPGSAILCDANPAGPYYWRYYASNQIEVSCGTVAGHRDPMRFVPCLEAFSKLQMSINTPIG